MTLRADTARHIITGATVLIFSAAAIGTAMRFQDSGQLGSLADDVELAAEGARAPVAAEPTPMRFTDGSRGIGSDIGVKLDGTTAFGGSAALWPIREGSRAGTTGGAAWWASPESRLAATSRRSGSGSGSIGGVGSGYAISGTGRGNAAPTAGAGPKPNRGGSSSPRSSGGGVIFDEHTGSLDDLVADGIKGDLLGGIPDGGKGGMGGGGLSQTPEPASLLLMATGVAGVIGAARRRQSRRR